MMTFLATGTGAAPPSALAAGVYFWRLRGIAHGVVGTNNGPVWQFYVGARSAPIDSSWGSVPDVNGDGYSDVVVGALDLNANPRVGQVYVYLGGAQGVATIPAATLDDPGGEDALFGQSVVSAGDVNGDGYADVLVSALSNSAPGATGQAYVYFGGPSGLGAVPGAALTEPALIRGYGVSVASAGDVDGDGYSDVLVAAFCVDDCGAAAYLYLGSSTGPATTPATTLDVFGPTIDTFSWLSIAGAGDVNGDGFADVVVGEGHSTEQAGAGEVAIYEGSAAGLSATSATVISSPVATPGAFGAAVASAGDVDGDGLADVLVGAGNGTIGTPGAYLYLGGVNGLVVPAATTFLAPYATRGFFGDALSSAGDVNGDGFADVVVASPADAEGLGIAQTFLGGSGGLIATQASTLADPTTTDYQFGISVACAGDVNGDGFADVGVATGYGGLGSVGRAYLYLGAATGLATAPAATFTAPSGADGAGFGQSVADVGDGLSRWFPR
jgi:hypothetical protein